MSPLFCQIDFYIETDESNYSLNQDVFITFYLHNTSNDTVTVIYPESPPFNYYIDDVFFDIGAFQVHFEILLPPDSTLSSNHIHQDFLDAGVHTIVGVFLNYPNDWLTNPVTILVEDTHLDNIYWHDTRFQLSAYPNPFHSSTTISFSTTNSHENALIEIYNIKGQRIREIGVRNEEIGMNRIVWDGRDNSGKSVSSGIYFYQLQIDKKQVATKKCLLLN